MINKEMLIADKHKVKHNIKCSSLLLDHQSMLLDFDFLSYAKHQSLSGATKYEICWDSI